MLADVRGVDSERLKLEERLDNLLRRIAAS
jgi:hypothetical protein